MNFNYRQGTLHDLCKLKYLAIKSWGQFQSRLTPDNWNKLYGSLADDKTFTDLLDISICTVCTTDDDKIIGMAFFVPRGNHTELYDKEWSCIRLLSVDPDFGGQGIGRKLTKMCIELARSNGEKIIALHTSELMDKARHLYEALGFTILKEIDPRLGKRYWLYILDLGKQDQQ